MPAYFDVVYFTSRPTTKRVDGDVANPFPVQERILRDGVLNETRCQTQKRQDHDACSKNGGRKTGHQAGLHERHYYRIGDDQRADDEHSEQNAEEGQRRSSLNSL